jgi:putative acetyltransferase
MALGDEIGPIGRDEATHLLDVWEASVRATHHFLAEADIQFFKPLVVSGVYALPHLLGMRDGDRLVAFLGVGDGAIEALFVHPAWLRRGIGRRLVRHAVGVLQATRLDVNEQNVAAVAFYRSQGFEVVGRSPYDGTGLPFPLLHMRFVAGPAG